MIDRFCQNPGLTLLAIFLYGIAMGLLLALGIMHLFLSTEKRTDKRNQAIQEQAALAALQEAPIEIDDDRMMCEMCWKERHPGLRWFFSSITEQKLCKAHAEVLPHTEEAALEEVLSALAS